jgi:hypothetical protein
VGKATMVRTTVVNNPRQPEGVEPERMLNHQQYHIYHSRTPALYRAANTRSHISYAVHQAARHTHAPRGSHAVAVKRILRYLKGTKDKGLYFKPDSTDLVDCYVDADFAGLFSVEDGQAPVSVKSRTGYVIMYSGVPVLWVSKMQTQIALSTMEAEYIALSQSMRDLIPIQEMLKDIKRFMIMEEGYTPKCTTQSKAFKEVEVGEDIIPPSLVYEDNEACLKFAQMPKLSPRTKHIGVPFHWFRTKIINLEISVKPIASVDQLADQFTKGLAQEPFEKGHMVNLSNCLISSIERESCDMSLRKTLGIVSLYCGARLSIRT